MVPLYRDDPRIVGPLPGPRSAAWLERDHRVMSPSYTRVYPLVVRRARGAMIEDMDGNRFLDFTAGIAVTNVGHSHPRVVAAIQRQSRPADPHVGDRFLLRAPGPAGRATGATGARTGPEARLLHQQRGRGDRGRPQAGAAAHRPESGPGVHERISRPNLRGDVAFRLEANAAAGLLRRWFPRSTTPRYGDLESVHALLRTICPPDELAAIFVEPIQGEGGYIVPPGRFPARPAQICDEHGVLLVFDEVQSGIGRTGKMFASRALGGRGRYRVPGQGDRQRPAPGGDRRAGLGDGLAQRQPCLDVRRQPRRVRRGAGDLAVDRAAIPRQCRVRGAAASRRAWTALAHRFPFIREVRGMGLMIGLEIQDRSGKPAPACATGSSTWPFTAACSCCPAARAPSGSARRSA